MRALRVHFLPELIAAADLAGSTCVVIDVLRATTTTVYALAVGARAVIPCLSIDGARQRAAAFSVGQAILGGERGGLAIPGFDLGNSPDEYTPGTVGGKTVVLTTTNGTKALLHCQQAAEVLIAAFVNLSAICDVLVSNAETPQLPLPPGEGRGEGGMLDFPHRNPLPKGEGIEQSPIPVDRFSIDLVCAGTDGEITREDLLLAGAIVARLSAKNSCELDDQAVIARDAWLRIMAHAAPAEVEPRLVEAMRASQGGQNLIALNMEHDIELAAEVDRFAIAPRYRAEAGLIDVEPCAAPPSP
ncbi:MAG: 2-phosphosulfolactate phosphatase [Planctomycetia bacterium]|nr:2-phosphosulfolactate phosphatase [Planctomycetia bacterium]